MFDVGASELLVIVIVAIVVIGPKDLPVALRAAGRWIGKMRRMSNHFRSGIETMIREAEMEEMEKKWAERNQEIMAKYPTAADPAGRPADSEDYQMTPLAPPPADPDASAEAAIARAAPRRAPEHGGPAGDGDTATPPASPTTPDER